MKIKKTLMLMFGTIVCAAPFAALAIDVPTTTINQTQHVEQYSLKANQQQNGNHDENGNLIIENKPALVESKNDSRPKFGFYFTISLMSLLMFISLIVIVRYNLKKHKLIDKPVIISDEQLVGKRSFF